jgi:hypothetical protein
MGKAGILPTQMITHYHAKYFAYELTKQCPSDSIEKLAGAMASAQVDLNPHQVDAALFAFNSPLSRGALLAVEVGLGKTIDAGLVLSQKWAERKRRLLVINNVSTPGRTVILYDISLPQLCEAYCGSRHQARCVH